MTLRIATTWPDARALRENDSSIDQVAPTRTESSETHGNTTRLCGFTLIELMAVMVICAVIAAIVVVSARGHIARARMTAALEMLEACDGHVRHVARRNNTILAMRIQSGKSAIRLPNGQLRRFGRGISVDRIWTPHVAANRGTLNVVMSPTGQSDTYAIRLKPKTGTPRWFVVLGASGQCLQLKHESQVRQLLSIR